MLKSYILIEPSEELLKEEWLKDHSYAPKFDFNPNLLFVRDSSLEAWDNYMGSVDDSIKKSEKIKQIVEACIKDGDTATLTQMSSELEESDHFKKHMEHHKNGDEFYDMMIDKTVAYMVAGASELSLLVDAAIVTINSQKIKENPDIN